jgi:hypothetical protein
MSPLTPGPSLVLFLILIITIMVVLPPFPRQGQLLIVAVSVTRVMPGEQAMDFWDLHGSARSNHGRCRIVSVTIVRERRRRGQSGSTDENGSERVRLYKDHSERGVFVGRLVEGKRRLSEGFLVLLCERRENVSVLVTR